MSTRPLRRTGLATASVLLPLALVLSACSGGSESAEDAAAPTSASAGAEETTEVVAEVEESRSPEQLLAEAKKQLKASIPANAHYSGSYVEGGVQSFVEVDVQGTGSDARVAVVLDPTGDATEVTRVGDTLYLRAPESQGVWASTSLSGATGADLLPPITIFNGSAITTATAQTASAVVDHGATTDTIDGKAVQVRELELTSTWESILKVAGPAGTLRASGLSGEVTVYVHLDRRGDLVSVTLQDAGQVVSLYAFRAGKVTVDAPAGAVAVD
ncbi:hypothetical protein [Nocardioides bruguierae]|uniref:hypothetical protein n=1 Tax=Nocardioides bruguierae TaxID=2945102 RepID=UPI002022687E|nr:hypothetical protein [Nocardioides bruguierae]MCL8027284.1 hypothetical protein [Nocardioides bruguierae]